MTDQDCLKITENAIQRLYRYTSKTMCFALEVATSQYNIDLLDEPYTSADIIFKRFGISRNDFYHYIDIHCSEDLYRYNKNRPSECSIWIGISKENNIIRAKYLTSKINAYLEGLESK